MTAPANFDRLAKAYRWMEYATFGRMLERCRFYYLPNCATAHRALILGDGDGRFAQRLLQINPRVEVDAVDASERMLKELHQRAVAANSGAILRLRTVQADIRTFSPEKRGYDLLVSHFFLDCLTENDIAALAARLGGSTGANARWVISDFAIPSQGWLRLPARCLIRALYFAFFLLTHLRVRALPDYARVLQSNGYVRLEQKRLMGGLLVTEIWQAGPNTSRI